MEPVNTKKYFFKKNGVTYLLHLIDNKSFQNIITEIL